MVRAQYGKPWLTDTELLFERKTVIPKLQYLLANKLRQVWEVFKFESSLVEHVVRKQEPL